MFASDGLLTATLLLAALGPLIGAIASTVWLWKEGQRFEIGLVSCGSLLLSTICSLVAVAQWSARPVVAETGQRQPIHTVLANIVDAEAVTLSLELLVDGLTVVMAATVCIVSLCVSVYALGYLAEERERELDEHGADVCRRPGRFATFFCVLQLFVFCMLGIVTAGGLFQAFVFWELVGLCSYLLIGFYRERAGAGAAATKAFVVNRVGDAGFLIGLGLLATQFGTLSLSPETGLTTLASNAPTGLLTAASLAIFAGAAGKSAQLPFQVWLPDAMAGPTPVSALVHSATMVAAGVYLVARTYLLFTPDALTVVAYVGCGTLFVAALFAFGATDIKRILAWSTVSQLGYMMLALGIGGWTAAVFHLITHACFKSLLFLTAGAVLVGVHHRQSLGDHGGLLRRMPWTAGLMLIGAIAICGLSLPFVTIGGEAIAFSGYHSKDAILTTSLALVQDGSRHPLLFVVPLGTAGLTAAYMFRLWCGLFLATPRSEAAESATEVGWSLRIPMIVLAILAIGVAIGGESERGLLHHLLLSSRPDFGIRLSGEAFEAAHKTAAVLSLMAAAAGSITAIILYGRRGAEPTWFGRRLPSLVRFLRDGGGFDRLYADSLIRPAIRTGRGLIRVDAGLLDGVIHRIAAFARWAARADERFDATVVDGAVNVIGDVVLGGGRSASRVQTGQLRQYVLFLVAGLLCVFAAVFTLLA